MLKIVKVLDTSPLVPKNGQADSKVAPGDKLISINGAEIADFIDYRYAESDTNLSLTILRGNRQFSVKVKKRIDQSLGLEFDQDKIRRCRNKCIFCFCHNNPKQLRRTLYVKDDDYRYSFLHGSFVTLTNLREEDITRIIDLHLSPLYVSVHATDDKTRQAIFGRKDVQPVLPTLNRFAENGIAFHCQVVIVPGYNDGERLAQTAADLAKLQPYASSLAVVPVGLTNYSNPELKPVTPKKALELIDMVSKFRKRYGDRDNHFAYAADELFIKAGLDIPNVAYYDEFPQIENGVGMVRDFLDTFPKKLPSKLPGIWITGQSMIKVWRKVILPKYNTKMRLIPVTNKLFGPKVTVSGLLPGRGIINALRSKKFGGEPIILPPNCLNHDGLFIDDLTIAKMEEILKNNVIQGSYSFRETLEMVA